MLLPRQITKLQRLFNMRTLVLNMIDFLRVLVIKGALFPLTDFFLIGASLFKISIVLSIFSEKLR